MAKSNGIKSLKQAAKLLNKHSPDGESLAYINPEEAKLLRSHGGSGITTLAGVPSYFTHHKLIDWGKKQLIDYGLGKVQDWLGGDEQPDDAYLNQQVNLPRGTVMPPLYQTTDDAYFNQQVNLPEGENPFVKDLGSSIFQSGKEFLKKRYGGVVGIKQGGKDLLATLAFLKGKKDREGLNDDEMKVFDELTRRTEAAQAEFQANIAGGGVQNVPSKIEDVSRFTEVDIPTMKTTAAEGGRIGYGLGSKTATAYADPNRVVTGDPSENLLSYFANKYSGDKQVLPFTGGQAMSGDNFMANMLSQSSQGSQFTLLNEYQNYVTEVGEENAIPFEEWKMSRIVSAHGGRIGAFNGGIQGLMPQQGMPQQGMPQQGFMPQPGLMPPQGLDPRMGYAAQGGRIGFNSGGETAYEKWLIDKYDLLVSDLSWDDHSKYSKLFRDQKAQGGRIGAQGGGIMPLLDMGGMEKDYRQDGGFVPIGRREKADDVPARLSKNEFVFTADAVKAAGGGDIDEGAQRMYNVMKNLEAGGEISQQSQGQG